MERVAFVGIDWADQKHAWAGCGVADGNKDEGSFSSKPEAVHEWVAKLRELYPGGIIVVMIEQSRGALIYALMRYDFLEIVPINPRAAKAYRESLHLSGAKDDPSDARLHRDFGAGHIDQLRPLKIEDVLTRKLRLLVEARRNLVDQRTANVNALGAACKQYFPQVLEWFGGADATLTLAFLQSWPTLEQAQSARHDAVRRLVRSHSRWSEEKIQALFASIRSAVSLTEDPAIIEATALLSQALAAMILVVDQQVTRHDKAIAELWNTHPDHDVFDSFPGAGLVMAPRLAVAFGLDRSRWHNARDIQTYSGIAPVVEASGKQRWVHARWRCPKFLRQSFHEFAQASLPFSSWALAFYREQKDRGCGHHAAVRALAYRWMRILFSCWKNNEPYDEARYLKQLAAKGSPLMKRIAA